MKLPVDDKKGQSHNVDSQGLRLKTRNFLDKTLEEPRKSLTDSYIETHHNKLERKTAGDTASRLYNRPASQLYLKKHRELARKTKIELLEHARSNKDKLGYASLANTISEQILDRTDGKPIQTQQTMNTNLNVNLDVSKELSDSFTEFLKAKTSPTEPI